MPVALTIDELLYNVLATQDLLKFAPILARDSITKIDHLKDVTNEELASYGLSQPAIRRLRSALLDKELQKKIEKRIKKKKEIKYINVSNLEEYKPPQQPQVKVPDDQNRVPSPHHVKNEDTASTSSSSTQLALILKDQIKLMEKLGEGTFAVVKRGLWCKSEMEKIDVAVKIIREINEEVKKDIQAEVNTMSKLRHPNLIQLYGVVFDDPMLMVMEFCDGGALLDRLRSSDKPILLATQLLNYSVQIAAGMKYLEEKNYVHRDLATRNILLTKNDQEVKICDFGLSRVVDENERLYILQGVKKVPFSWCPPESLRYRKFSSASDVWAYGVTLWEIWTYGEEPWIGYGALKVLEATERGERLRRPENAPNNIFDLMYSCWMLKPTDRPNFPKIYWDLSRIKFETREAKADHIPTIPAHIALKKGQRFIILEEPSPTTVHGQNVTTREYGHVLKNVLGNAQPFHQVQDSGGIVPIRPAPTKPPVNNQVKVNPVLNPQPLPNLTMNSQSKIGQSFNSQLKGNLIVNNQPKINPAPLPSSKPVVRESRNIEISSPVRNSIIHTGHGDGDLSRSWGDPGKIPDVYLKNPVTNPVVATDVGKGIPLVQMNTNIPMKSSLPKSPVDSARSLSTISSGFGSGESSIASVEAWNRSRMSSMGGNESQISSRSQPNFQHRKISEHSEVMFRTDNSQSNFERPKTMMDVPFVPSHNVQNKKISMNEQRKAQQVFSWVGSELEKNKKFNDIVIKNEQNKNNEFNRIQKKDESTNFSTTVNYGKKNENGTNIGQRNEGLITTTAASSSTLSTLTLANTPMPSFSNGFSSKSQVFSTGFSPKSQNEPDPFVVPDQAKSILAKPSYRDMLNNKTNTNGNSSNLSNLSSSSSSSTLMTKMDPAPINRPFHTLGPASSKQIGQQVLRELESRHGQIQATPQQVAQAYPSLDELIKKSQNPQINRFTDPVSLLPPPSPLFQSLDGSKNHTNTVTNSRPRPKSTTTVFTKTTNYNPRPQLSVLQPTPLVPKPTVVPGTAPPSSDTVINNLISTMTTPTQPQSNGITETNNLFSQVKKEMPAADISDCQQALLKHNNNVNMAVKDLKVQYLINVMKVTSDADCAASALDSCDWDLNRAVERLLS